VDADAKCIGERPLGHPQEAPQRHNIVAPLKLTTSDALAQLVRNRAVEIALCQLASILTHILSPMYRLKNWASDVVARRALIIRTVSSWRSV
jgi:hypothetical protein